MCNADQRVLPIRPYRLYGEAQTNEVYAKILMRLKQRMVPSHISENPYPQAGRNPDGRLR